MGRVLVLIQARRFAPRTSTRPAPNPTEIRKSGTVRARHRREPACDCRAHTETGIFRFIAVFAHS